MNYENEYLIKLNKYVGDKCSKNCNFAKVEEKILFNYEPKINLNEMKLFKDDFECFDKCNSKYFESGLISLKSLSEFLNK